LVNVIKFTQFDDVPNNCHLSTLYQEESAYCYHSVNVITLTPAQSDHIKRLPLQIIFMIQKGTFLCGREPTAGFWLSLVSVEAALQLTQPSRTSSARHLRCLVTCNGKMSLFRHHIKRYYDTLIVLILH